MAQAASKSCEICASGAGRHYCQQCEQFFCNSCKASHLRTKISKHHLFSGGPSINPAEKLSCSEHDEPFIFYCVDCDSVVCKRCAVKRHNRHNMSEINESVLKLKAKLAHDVESSVNGLMNDIAHVEDGIREYKSENKSIIKAINKDAQRMKDLIDQKAEELINSVKKNGKKNIQILSTAYTELKETFYRVDKIQMSIVNTVQISDVALLQKIKQLQAKNDEIEKKKVPYIHDILKDEYSRKEITQNEIGKLFGELHSRKSSRKTKKSFRQEEKKHPFKKSLTSYTQNETMMKEYLTDFDWTVRPSIFGEEKKNQFKTSLTSYTQKETKTMKALKALEQRVRPSIFGEEKNFVRESSKHSLTSYNKDEKKKFSGGKRKIRIHGDPYDESDSNEPNSSEGSYLNDSSEGESSESK